MEEMAGVNPPSFPAKDACRHSWKPPAFPSRSTPEIPRLNSVPFCLSRPAPLESAGKGLPQWCNGTELGMEAPKPPWNTRWTSRGRNAKEAKRLLDDARAKYAAGDVDEARVQQLESLVGPHQRQDLDAGDQGGSRQGHPSSTLWTTPGVPGERPRLSGVERIRPAAGPGMTLTWAEFRKGTTPVPPGVGPAGRRGPRRRRRVSAGSSPPGSLPPSGRRRTVPARFPCWRTAGWTPSPPCGRFHGAPLRRCWRRSPSRAGQAGTITTGAHSARPGWTWTATAAIPATTSSAGTLPAPNPPRNPAAGWTPARSGNPTPAASSPSARESQAARQCRSITSWPWAMPGKKAPSN